MTKVLMPILFAVVVVLGAGCSNGVSALEEHQDSALVVGKATSPTSAFPGEEKEEDTGGDDCDNWVCTGDDLPGGDDGGSYDDLPGEGGNDDGSHEEAGDDDGGPGEVKGDDR